MDELLFLNFSFNNFSIAHLLHGVIIVGGQCDKCFLQLGCPRVLQRKTTETAHNTQQHTHARSTKKSKWIWAVATNFGWSLLERRALAFQQGQQIDPFVEYDFLDMFCILRYLSQCVTEHRNNYTSQLNDGRIFGHCFNSKENYEWTRLIEFSIVIAHHWLKCVRRDRWQ